jgi:hypothetical protein
METVFLPPHERKVNEVNDSVEFENAEDMRCTRMLFLSALGNQTIICENSNCRSSNGKKWPDDPITVHG